MKRYVISPVIGSGTEADPYRASASAVAGVGSSFVIPSKSDGTPKYAFCFGLVATTSINSVAAMSNVFVFPDLSLDALMSAMDAAARMAMNQSVAAYVLDANSSPPKHFDTTFYGDSNSYRDVLNGLLQQTEPAANIANLDASETA